MREIMVVNAEDLLYYCEEIGYFWNQAHAILFGHGRPDDRIGPGHIRDEHFTDAYAFGYSDELKKIMLGFFKKHGIDEFYLTEKNRELYT